MRFKRYENKSIYIDFTMKDFKQVYVIFGKDMRERQNVYIFPNNLNDEHLCGLKRLLEYRDRLKLHDQLNIVIYSGVTPSVKKWIRLYLKGYKYKLIGGRFDPDINGKQYCIIKENSFLRISIRNREFYLRDYTSITIQEDYISDIHCYNKFQYDGAEKAIADTLGFMEKEKFDELSRIVYFYDILMHNRIKQLKERKE